MSIKLKNIRYAISIAILLVLGLFAWDYFFGKSAPFSQELPKEEEQEIMAGEESPAVAPEKSLRSEVGPNELILRNCAPITEKVRVNIPKGPLNVRNDGSETIDVRVVEQTKTLKPKESATFGPETFVRGIGEYGFVCIRKPLEGTSPQYIQGAIVVEGSKDADK